MSTNESGVFEVSGPGLWYTWRDSRGVLNIASLTEINPDDLAPTMTRLQVEVMVAHTRIGRNTAVLTRTERRRLDDIGFEQRTSGGA